MYTKNAAVFEVLEFRCWAAVQTQTSILIFFLQKKLLNYVKFRCCTKLCCSKMSCHGTRRKKKNKGGEKTQSISSAEKELKGRPQLAVIGHGGEDPFDVSRLALPNRESFKNFKRKLVWRPMGRILKWWPDSKDITWTRKTNTNATEQTHKLNNGDYLVLEMRRRWVVSVVMYMQIASRGPTPQEMSDSLFLGILENLVPFQDTSGENKAKMQIASCGILQKPAMEQYWRYYPEHKSPENVPLLPTHSLCNESKRVHVCRVYITFGNQRKRNKCRRKQGLSGINSPPVSLTQTVDICSAMSSQESVTLPASATSTKWCAVHWNKKMKRRRGRRC